MFILKKVFAQCFCFPFRWTPKVIVNQFVFKLKYLISLRFWSSRNTIWCRFYYWLCLSKFQSKTLNCRLQKKNNKTTTKKKKEKTACQACRERKRTNEAKLSLVTSVSSIYLSINGKFLKKAFVLLTMKVTSKKQHRSFVENSMHKVNFCTFKSAAKVLKVVLAAGLQKKKC